MTDDTIEPTHPLTPEEFIEVAQDSDNYDIFADRLVATVVIRDEEIAKLRDLLKSGFAYVRDANRMMAADGDLDEEDEDGANEWMESVAAALGGGNIEEEREGETIDE